MQSFKLLGFLWQTKRIFPLFHRAAPKATPNFVPLCVQLQQYTSHGRRKGGGIRENKVITSWHINVMMLQTSKNVTWSSDTVQTENILAKHSISYLTTQFLFCIIVNLKTSRNCFSSACYGLQNTAEKFKAVSLMKAEKWCNRNLTALCALCISYKLPNQQRREQQLTLQSLQQAVSKRYGIWVPERSNYRHENVMCVGSNHPKLSHTHSIYIAVPL